MNETAASGKTTSSVRSGAIAGALSTVTFLFIHQIFISDIWGTLVPMTIAGLLSGVCLAWSYSRVVRVPTILNWIRYNAAYVLALILLGLVSVAIFEPITTMAAILEGGGGPPDELMLRALPLTGVFAIATSMGLALIYRGGPRGLGALFLTTIVLITLLGLNISVIGLVSIPQGSLYLIAEMYALILALAAVYVGLFVALERRRFSGRPPA